MFNFKKFAFLFLLSFLWGFIDLFGQESLNLMFYNIYRYPYHTPSNREWLLKEINNEMQPDLLMVCELVDEHGADRILNVSFQDLEDPYSRAPFVASPTATYDPLHQMVFFNQRKLELVAHQQHITEVRDINQYTFYLKTTNLIEEDTTYIEVFVCHLKSSDGNQNRWARKSMVDTFFKALEQVPSDRLIVFGGDFNFYDAHLEPALNKIISPNNTIVMKDPLDAYGKWHANEEFQSIHTQSTRITTQGFGSGGAGGGLDDRFDFIFLSENFWDHPRLNYLEGSYQAVGNNGNCYKNRIDAPECDGVYSQFLREQLYYMSDHLPVFLTLEVQDDWLEPITVRELHPEYNFLPRGNKVGEVLWMQKPGYLKQKISYVLLDLTGKVFFNGDLPSEEIISIDVSHMNSGIYFIHFYGLEAYHEVYKILKF